MTLLNLSDSDSKKQIVKLLMACSLIWFLILSIKVGISKYFSIDEFYYTHAAWLLSKGEVPYRDFFLDKHPLLCQMLSYIFTLIGDHPTNIKYARYAMALPMLITVFCLWRLTRLKLRSAALLTPIFLLSCNIFTIRALEIRPDSLAISFSAMMFALLLFNKSSSKWTGIASGCLYVLAIWASKKAILYTMGVPIILLIGVLGGKVSFIKSCRFKGVSLKDFAIGALIPIILIFVYLVHTDSLAGWWKWGFLSAWEHQMHYPTSTTLDTFKIFLLNCWFVLPIALLGIMKGVQDFKNDAEPGNRSYEILLFLFFIGSILSFAPQKSAYPYSLIPIVASMAIYVSRGAHFLYIKLADSNERKNELFVLGSFLIIVYSVYASFGYKVLFKATHKYQLEKLSLIHEMSNADDVIYDNSGSFVSRPHVNFFYQTCKWIRKQYAEYLSSQIPKDIIEKECSIFIADARSGGLPEDLQDFLINNFVSYDSNIYIWGKKISSDSEDGKNSEFHAIKDGKYFVYPDDTVKYGLWIDGSKIKDSIFNLRKGTRKVFSEKETPFYIIWLPRNEEVFKPDYTYRKRFSEIL